MLSSAVAGTEKEVYMRSFGANLVACWPLLVLVDMRTRVWIEAGSESFGRGIGSGMKRTLSFTRLWWTANPIELTSNGQDAISRFLNE